MALVLKLKSTEGTTLWNFLDILGTENPGSCACDLRWLAWDSREPVASLIESDTRDGGWIGKTRQPLKSSTHGFNLSAPTKDGLLEGYNALAAHLADGKGKYFEYQLTAATATEYLDFTHGWPAALIMDEDSAKWVEDRIRAPNLPVTIVHQPYFRLDEIDAALNKLTNATLLCDEDNDGRPNDWTWASAANISAESITNGYYNFTISTADPRDLGQFWTGAVPGDIVTGFFEAYTDDIANGRVLARIRFWDATTVLATHMSDPTTPSDDPDNPTIVFKTTDVAPAGTIKAEMILRSDNLAASAIDHSWRHANLSRTNTVPTFRSGIEIVSNDPASTTTGRRARAFPIHIESDGPAYARLRLESTVGDWGSNSIYPALRVAALTPEHSANPLAWLNTPRRYVQAESGTAGTDTTLVGDVYRTSFATNNTLDVARISFILTTGLDGLRGKFLVLPCAKPDNIGSTFSLRMSWGFDSNLTHMGPITSWAPDEATFEPFLGQIVIPPEEDISALRLALYARRDIGAADLDWDFCSFVPPLTTWFDTTLNVGEVLHTDPEIPVSHVYNTSDQLLSYARIKAGTTPFVLPPGLNIIYIADEESANFDELATARIVYEPTRHA